MFILNVIGLYVCYISSSIVQERIYDFTSDDGSKFQNGTLLAFMKMFMAFLLARSLVHIQGGDRKKVRGNSAVSSAVICLLGTVCSLYSLDFISFPQLLIGRSMKLVPIFIADTLFNRKETSCKRFLCVIVTTLGVFLFSSESIINHSENNNLVGFLFISVTLFLDGALSVAQTKMLDVSEKPTPLETMVYMSSWQSIFSFALVLFSIDEHGGVWFCIKNPIVICMILAVSAIESVGQVCLYMILVNHGTFMTAFVTTLRKFTTILLSIVLFHHSMSNIQWAGVAMVLTGALIDIFNKRSKPKTSVTYVEVPTKEPEWPVL